MTPGLQGARAGTEFGPAREADLDSLVSIDRASPRPWNREAFADELNREPPSLLVLRAAGTPVGFAVARAIGPDLDIVNLAVDARRRRLGLGRLLLRSLLDRAAAAGARTAFLEVREGNREARGLYESAGFRETQRRKNFYRDPAEDAILMRFEMGPNEG